MKRIFYVFYLRLLLKQRNGEPDMFLSHEQITTCLPKWKHLECAKRLDGSSRINVLYIPYLRKIEVSIALQN